MIFLTQTWYQREIASTRGRQKTPKKCSVIGADSSGSRQKISPDHVLRHELREVWVTIQIAVDISCVEADSSIKVLRLLVMNHLYLELIGL